MPFDLKIYGDGKIYLSTNKKEYVYTAIRFLVKEVEKLEIRGLNEVTIYDVPEKK